MTNNSKNYPWCRFIPCAHLQEVLTGSKKLKTGSIKRIPMAKSILEWFHHIP